ncbi:MAG: hypothetical protein L3J52_07460, partial [Proteobacteria bacterium]|nr:hypothetical protein [Pseudomonadota bacterium]
MKKLFIFFVLVVSLVVITKFTLNENSTDQKIKDQVAQIILTDKSEQTVLQNTPVAVSDKNPVPQLDIHGLAFNAMIKQANVCGFNGETNTEIELATLIHDGSIDSLSEKQQNVLQKIIDGCKDWYSALDELNLDEIDSLKNKIDYSMMDYMDFDITTFSKET